MLMVGIANTIHSEQWIAIHNATRVSNSVDGKITTLERTQDEINKRIDNEIKGNANNMKDKIREYKKDVSMLRQRISKLESGN